MANSRMIYPNYNSKRYIFDAKKMLGENDANGTFHVLAFSSLHQALEFKRTNNLESKEPFEMSLKHLISIPFMIHSQSSFTTVISCC